MNTIIDDSFFESVLKKTRLVWQADPTEFLWLRTPFEGRWLRVKINSEFPDGAAYRLVLDDGHIDFDDFPPAWERGPLKWPESARR